MLGAKKIGLTIITIMLLVMASVLVHKVYAGSARISLNSPVSFPVDI